MLHEVGVSFDLYYDARKHKIKKSAGLILTLKGDQMQSSLRVVACDDERSSHLEVWTEMCVGFFIVERKYPLRTLNGI